MQVLVVRHAIAEQREEFARTGKDDSQRPLTHDGRRKMRRGAVGLRAVVPAIDVLATSPLLRAVQTAEILAAVYNGRNMVTVKGLFPTASFPRSSGGCARRMPAARSRSWGTSRIYPVSPAGC